ncbi:hypothetical protein [uncultured Microbulbifer sp.]|uniref:hypothetical protein n=1 Tax=uncultured Microbulbifer sp. TaxID=348147 RepID=UPI0025E9F937|nr:hypothetical protein [uncultured Microbulbifer sp.]
MIVPNPGTWDKLLLERGGDPVKSHDIGLLLKLVSLQKQELRYPVGIPDGTAHSGVQEVLQDVSKLPVSVYSARGLEAETGISKSQINLSLNRCIDVGLATKDRNLGIPRANKKALYEFIVYGIRYVFPAKPGRLTRGVATAFAAPVLRDKLMSAGDLQPVWPDAIGDIKGLEVEPLFKSAVFASRKDPEMYALLALVDAIRIGQARERNLASDLLRQHLGLEAYKGRRSNDPISSRDIEDILNLVDGRDELV